MTDAKAQARQRAIDHMTRLLQMNPIHQGEEIVRARVEALGLAKKAEGVRPAAREEQRADRRKLLDELEAVRSKFWTMPIADLNNQLNALNSQGFVDLEAAVTRLRVVAAHRGQFPILAQKPGFDGEFFSSLKEVLVRSPRDTAVLREQVLSTFRDRARRKSGRRMVALLKTDMPAIYDLEADWFNTLSRQKTQLPTIRLTSSSRPQAAAVGTGTNARHYWWVIMVVVGVVRAITSVSENSHSSTSSPKIPNVHYEAPAPYLPRPKAPGFSEGESQVLGSQDKSFGGDDKGVWQPYGAPSSSQWPEHPEPQSPSESQYPFATPRYVHPIGPPKGPDGRFH